MNINRRWYLGAIAGIGMLSFSCAARKDDPQVQVAISKDAKPKDAKSEFAAIVQEFQIAQRQLTKKVQEIEDRTEQRKYAMENFSKLSDPFFES